MASRDLKPSLERNQLSSVLDAVLEVQLVQRRTTEAVTKVKFARIACKVRYLRSNRRCRNSRSRCQRRSSVSELISNLYYLRQRSMLFIQILLFLNFNFNKKYLSNLKNGFIGFFNVYFKLKLSINFVLKLIIMFTFYI